MCVAIYKPVDKVLSKRTLKKCFRANPDGAGFAFLDEKKNVDIKKGFFRFQEFWMAYREYEKREAIIHFRWATHGAENQENCHPFPIPDGALIHNGIISWAAPKLADTRSDTRIFTEDLLTGFLEAGNDPRDKHFQQTLENVIGTFNKIAMFYKGERVILNEALGQWQDGVWYSNMAWKYEGVRYYQSSCLVDDWEPKAQQPYVYEGQQFTAHNDGTLSLVPRSTLAEARNLWDEEEEDLGREAWFCDTCGGNVPRYELIGLGADEVCRRCFLEYGSWEEDLRTSEDAEYDRRLAKLYYDTYERETHGYGS
jgi:hypothetical protein